MPDSKRFSCKADTENALGNIIELAHTEWAIRIVFVPKKDGLLRFFVDFPRLNAVKVRDSFFLLRMD